MALIGVFPLCSVLYDVMARSYRGIVVIILPIWKFAAKRFAVRMIHELEVVPELVAFSVDFFSALFVSVCMSTSGSFHLAALFIAVDLLFALMKFRVLQKIVRTPRAYRVTSLDRVRLWASPPHRVPEKLSERLQQLEYLVLVEYIECVVPFIYVIYKSVLEQLPNVVYFPGGAGHWDIPAVTNLLRKFGFSPLYQLAFVLETQASAIQAHLFPVTIFLLQYQLAHLGMRSFF
ncbi:hypothetical protein JG687_00011360 [Phytophthora cactorum]|uniref:Uncharacterized protein n=1 Tax=Phytophthora cactorum TaxID=29920 RepID=A0A8T1U753_9STRA|nr:hypothetical protein JG687_00011360 [Phytophthora cactorum]